MRTSAFSLRELLAAEEAQYLQEATASKETLAERIGKMRQKAKRIREEKEGEHAKLVQEKYDQRFRRDCAELRELQSKELDYELGNEHLWQMQEKEERKKDRKVRIRLTRDGFDYGMIFIDGRRILDSIVVQRHRKEEGARRTRCSASESQIRKHGSSDSSTDAHLRTGTKSTEE